MRLSTFRDRLDAWGAAVETWPPAERDAARRLLAADEAARRHLAEAERLERLLTGTTLGSCAPDPASARILSRLATLPPQMPESTSLSGSRSASLSGWRSALFGWRPAGPQVAALAMAALVGIVVGASGIAPVVSDALGNGSIGADDDLSALVLASDVTTGFSP